LGVGGLVEGVVLLQNRNKHKFYINILNFCAKFERSSFQIRLYAKISDFLPIVHWYIAFLRDFGRNAAVNVDELCAFVVAFSLKW